MFSDSPADTHVSRFKLYKIIGRIFIIVIVLMSILLNLMMFYLEVIPVVKNKFFKSSIVEIRDLEYLEGIIVDASVEMFLSDNNFMVMREPSSFLYNLNHLIKRKPYDLKNYYPRGFLALGLVNYAIKSNNYKLLDLVKNRFDELYLSEDGLGFSFNLVDQAPIGLASIKLYNLTGDNKYKNAADSIYNILKSKVTYIGDVPIIFYRDIEQQEDLKYLVDTLGMICPFLVEYSNEFKCADALTLAMHQMTFFISHGLDKETSLPFHAVDISTLNGVGPNNWGRGIGWYALGLSSLARAGYGNEKGRFFRAEILEFLESVSKFKKNDVYEQFLGIDSKMDSSATLLLFYAENVIKQSIDLKGVSFDVLSQFVTEDGYIDFCSGDTYGVNRYSQSFGVSEFSQGMFLLFLSSYKR